MNTSSMKIVLAVAPIASGIKTDAIAAAGNGTVGAQFIPECGGVTTFAGLSECSYDYSFRDVADKWCELGNGAGSVATSWTALPTGTRAACRFLGNELGDNPGVWSSYDCTGNVVGRPGSCKCMTNLQCTGGTAPPPPPSQPSIPACGAVTTFAGLSECSYDNSHSDVADSWCNLNRAGSVATSYTVVPSGTIPACRYLSDTLGVNPGVWNSYDCSGNVVGRPGSCKCLQNLQCSV